MILMGLSSFFLINKIKCITIKTESIVDIQCKINLHIPSLSHLHFRKYWSTEKSWRENSGVSLHSPVITLAY